jgi:hypothetical protein
MICKLSDNPPASCNSTDEPKTGLIVGLVAAGIAAMGLVAFFLKRRTNRKPQVSPHLGTENDAVISAIAIEDGAKAPVKVPGKPPPTAKEILFEDVDSLSDVPINDLSDADEESVCDASFSSITSGYSYPAAEWSLPPALVADSQRKITNDEVSINEFEIRAPAGMLGIVLDTPKSGGVLNVKEIKSNSPLAGRVRVGDLLVAVDGTRVTSWSAGIVVRLIASKKHNPVRELIFARPKE